MNKSIFKSVVMAAVFVIGAMLPLQAFADQASSVRYYKKNLIDGFCHGIKISSGMTVSSRKRQQLEQIVDKFVTQTLLPTLKRNNITDEWIKSQEDPEIISLNNKAMQISDLAEIQTLLTEAMNLMMKKYPGLLNTMAQDSAYVSGFQQMMQDMVRVVSN